MNRLARLFALLLLAAAGLAHARNLQPTDNPEASPMWQKVRASLFESAAASRRPGRRAGRSRCRSRADRRGHRADRHPTRLPQSAGALRRQAST